jgi:EAL domain-containing protein (putative c-di-GMP-specific phosphodiesterase class I)
MRISIDDFGTGYSSLGVIRQLPVDELKIDRTFIQDLETSDSDQLIVRAILAMAHALDLQVVAEGVENNGQARLLKSFGCDFFQGYYFGRPVSIHQLKALYGPRHASSESGT